MNIKDIELRKDVQAHVRILYLIAHYDLENNLILESICLINIHNTRRVFNMAFYHLYTQLFYLILQVSRALTM